MSTIRDVTRDAGCVDVLQTDRAVGARHILYALMAVLQLDRQTHVALGAVEELVPPSDTTDTTAITMILILVFIVKQLALQAGVFTKT